MASNFFGTQTSICGLPSLQLPFDLYGLMRQGLALINPLSGQFDTTYGLSIRVGNCMSVLLRTPSFTNLLTADQLLNFQTIQASVVTFMPPTLPPNFPPNFLNYFPMASR